MPIDTTPDAPNVDAQFKPLVEGDWSLAAHDENYFCVYETLDRDIDVAAFHPVAPLGTHHTVLTLYSGSQPDGVVPCEASTNGTSMIYGSGVGAPDLALPDGVGLKLKKGQRVLLNLHLYNTGDDVLTGHSGVYVKEAAAGSIVHEAEVVLAGPTLTLQVPSGVTTQQGPCSVGNFTREPVTVFSLSQHMHKRGRKLKTVLTHAGTDTTLQDEPYTFDLQAFHSITPVTIAPGDTITTYCTYENTGATTQFGDSSDAEMCFSDLFYYPAQKLTYFCTN